MRIFKSYRGWSDLKILTSEYFYSSKSSGIYNCQTWIYHSFKETENLFHKDLVFKRDLNEYAHSEGSFPFFTKSTTRKMRWSSTQTRKKMDVIKSHEFGSKTQAMVLLIYTYPKKCILTKQYHHILMCF